MNPVCVTVPQRPLDGVLADVRRFQLPRQLFGLAATLLECPSLELVFAVIVAMADKDIGLDLGDYFPNLGPEPVDAGFRGGHRQMLILPPAALSDGVHIYPNAGIRPGRGYRGAAAGFRVAGPADDPADDAERIGVAMV